jgi:hypothetical protein
MEPVSGMIVSKLSTIMASTLVKKVWTEQMQVFVRCRAQERLGQFLEKLADLNSVVNIESEEEWQQLIGKFDRDEYLKQALYDALRAVSFSKSRTIGPRLAAWILCRIESRGGCANEVEEIFFESCEKLTDIDFLWFYNSYLNPTPLEKWPPSARNMIDTMTNTEFPMISFEPCTSVSASIPRLVSCGLVMSAFYVEPSDNAKVHYNRVNSFASFKEFVDAIGVMR